MAFAGNENVDRLTHWCPNHIASDQLRYIERQPAPEGGGSYLMLLPKSKQWMLMNEYDYERFTIYLHGRREFIADVASQTSAILNGEGGRQMRRNKLADKVLMA